MSHKLRKLWSIKVSRLNNTFVAEDSDYKESGIDTWPTQACIGGCNRFLYIVTSWNLRASYFGAELTPNHERGQKDCQWKPGSGRQYMRVCAWRLQQRVLVLCVEVNETSPVGAAPETLRFPDVKAIS
ncbi:3591_t:CDS:2 [Ambispora gerdemannii]|uniref:3591_t:CDS:1 n=1 Tax=Ambispora gerdemannii TaxID=144530 RepID=A0A9N9CXE8_9GLOM|nr:3591_t:CDS:2 [Ambispora gerdemannii]